MGLQVTWVPAPPPSLAANLENYWKFDETSGNWLDSVGGNPVQPFGTPLYSAGGVIGHCLNTNGGSGVGYTGTGLNLAARSFTLAGWLKMTGPGTSNVNPILCQGDANGSGSFAFYLMYRTDTAPPQWLIQTNGGANFSLPGSYSEDGTTWYFWCWRYDKASSIMNFRVNTTDASPATNTGIPNASSGAGLAFGQLVYGGSGLNLNGLIDEVGVWGRSLSDAEVSTLFNDGAGQRPPFLATGLEHYWRLNEVGSADRVDSFGSNSLAVVGTPVSTAVAGHAGNCFDTNARTCYLEGPTLDLASRSFTIALWVQPFQIDVLYNDSVYILSQTTSGGVGTTDFDLRYSTGEGNCWQFQWGSSFEHNIKLPMGIDFSGATWYFLCARYEAVSGTMQLRANTTDAVVQVSAPSVGPTHTGTMKVGGLIWTSGVSVCGMRVDEIGIWGRSLSDSEVSQIYAGWTP